MIFLIVLKILFGMIDFSIFFWNKSHSYGRVQCFAEQIVRTAKVVCHFILVINENSIIFCFKSGKSQGISSQIFCMNPGDFTFLILNSSDINIFYGAHIQIATQNFILTFLLVRWF